MKKKRKSLYQLKRKKVDGSRSDELKRWLVFSSLSIFLLGSIFVFRSTNWIHLEENLSHEGVSGRSRQVVAPNFNLPDADGKMHRLSDFSGNFVLLHFWATWCPPCIDEIPRWLGLARELKDHPIQLVAISLDTSFEDAHTVFPAPSPDVSNLVSLLDEEGNWAKKFGSYRYPETYLISPQGVVVTKWVGPQDWVNLKARLLELSTPHHSNAGT